MVILRSGRILKTGCSSSSSSSVASISPKQVSHFKLPKKPGWTTVKKRADDPSMPYITEALKSYNQNSGKRYKLVDPGSLTTVILANYFLYHIDFEAKNTDAPHASTEIFFAELTSPSAWQVLSVRLCVSLGPVNSISDKLNGCYYCRRLNNVHHPKAGGFVRGGDTFYKTVEDIFDDATPYSTEAITFFNRQPHRSYELMEPGFFTRVVLPTCSLIHVNFTAKETDVDVARELFFAELTSTGEVLSCNFCVRLHPRDSALGDETGDKTNGCYYCREYNNVLHPKRGGFVRGGDSLYKTFP
ncbi:hypothetical protein ACET3Z_001645 [Daucus carota]